MDEKKIIKRSNEISNRKMPMKKKLGKYFFKSGFRNWYQRITNEYTKIFYNTPTLSIFQMEQFYSIKIE